MTRVGLSLPQLGTSPDRGAIRDMAQRAEELGYRSEEHTSELQSH